MKYYFDLLKNDIKKMSLREHGYYWVLPLVILSILITFYFSGVPTLEEFVCPKENWEWGILENIQLTIILAMFILAIYAFLKKKVTLQKWGFGLIALFAVFIFLEEIDYGAHFAQLIGGEQEIILKQYIPKNIHNQGNNAKLFKRSVYVFMLLLFVIAPFLKLKTENPYIKYLIPKPRIVIVAVLAIIIDLVPRLIVYFGIFEDGGLGTNIGEFSEVIVYHIFLIYLTQLIFENELLLGKKS